MSRRKIQLLSFGKVGLILSQLSHSKLEIVLSWVRLNRGNSTDGSPRQIQQTTQREQPRLELTVMQKTLAFSWKFLGISRRFLQGTSAASECPRYKPEALSFS